MGKRSIEKLEKELKKLREEIVNLQDDNHRLSIDKDRLIDRNKKLVSDRETARKAMLVYRNLAVGVRYQREGKQMERDARVEIDKNNEVIVNMLNEKWDQVGELPGGEV